MGGLIYLVQPPECIGTECYKIGMSQSNTIRRIRAYGSECINIISRECNNPAHVERELIEIFQLRFGKPVQGREWFNGNKPEMIIAFNECFDTHAEPVINELVEPSETASNVKSHTSRAPIEVQYYELFDILPDEWLNQREMYLKVIYTIRNAPMLPDSGMELIKRLFTNRSLVNETLAEDFAFKMNYGERRFGMAALSKIIKAQWPEEFANWHLKYKAKKVSASALDKVKLKIRYKQGASVALADIKANQPGMTTKKLLEMNSQFTSSIKDICKHCRSFHLKGCCTAYRRKDRLSSTIISNVELV